MEKELIILIGLIIINWIGFSIMVYYDYNPLKEFIRGFKNE